jgi:RHS repeat-associated protein
VAAGFVATPLTGSAPLTVTFTGQSSGAVDSHLWNYGDGTTGATSTLTYTHLYTLPGVYTVTLTVTGLGGNDTLTRTGYITVTWLIISHVITYTYDHLYRLTDADYSTGETFAYGYDAVGNRTVQTQTITSTTVTTYTYDDANRLDYYYEDGDQTDLAWDNNGNLLTQGTSVYTWDAANRLVSADVDGVVSTFAYNGLGQRTSQTVGGVTTEYVLDVAGGLPEVIVATTGGASTYYVQIQGQILAQQDSSAWAYALPGHLGSVRQLTNAGGQVTLAQSYDPFGVLFEAAGSGASGFGYTGEWWDAEAELLHLRARYYDPAVGRFLNEDTKPGIAYLPKSLHIYAYAWNNPVLLTDPTGWQPQPPHCNDPTQPCHTATPGPQETPMPQPVMTPPTLPESVATPPGTPPPPDPGRGSGGRSSDPSDAVALCLVLYQGEEREACLARVFQNPIWARYAGNACSAPDRQTFISDPNLIGDPFSSPGTGDRKYSYFKTQTYLVTGFFIGGADDLEDLPGVVGGTYRSELQAQVTVYEKGTFTEMCEAYDATNLHGIGVGVQISVARQAVVIANDLTRFAHHPFESVTAGDSGTSGTKRVWMSASQDHYPDRAIIYVTMHAENSLPLGPAGYGVQYSMSLRP